MFADCPQDYVWIWAWEGGFYMVLRQHGSAWCLVLEWTPEEASLLQDRPFSAAALVYISREAWEAQTFSSISEDRRLCMRLVLVSFTTAALLFLYMRHSTIDLSLLHLKRASEPSDIFLLGTRAPRDRILHEV